MKVYKGDVTRLRIIAVSTKLFLRHGLYHVTFKQIAKGAGLSQPAIYRHFSDLDDLIIESCRHWIQQFKNDQVDSFEGFSTGKMQLKEFLDRHLIYASRNRDQDGLLFGIYYHSMRSEKMAEFYKEIKIRALNRIRRMLHFGNIDGSWKLEDPNAYAETVHSIIVGEIIKVLIEPQFETEQGRTTRIFSHVMRLFNVDT